MRQDRADERAEHWESLDLEGSGARPGAGAGLDSKLENDCNSDSDSD